jgi:hypothetical protein
MMEADRVLGREQADDHKRMIDPHPCATGIFCTLHACFIVLATSILFRTISLRLHALLDDKRPLIRGQYTTIVSRLLAWLPILAQSATRANHGLPSAELIHSIVDQDGHSN